MGKKAKEQEQTPKQCRDCSHWQEMKDKIRVAKLLQNAIQKIESRFETDDFKPTLAEFLKLVQLEQELAQDEAKEIRVTWVEPAATSNEK